MSNSNIHFCKECNNLTLLQTNEAEKLFHYCKICELKEEYTGSGCVFSQDLSGLDKSIIINSNKYIAHDATLPSIEGNINIKCPNVNCEKDGGDDKSIKYLKHDADGMRFTYICEGCGQKWTN